MICNQSCIHLHTIKGLGWGRSLGFQGRAEQKASVSRRTGPSPHPPPPPRVHGRALLAACLPFRPTSLSLVGIVLPVLAKLHATSVLPDREVASLRVDPQGFHFQ